ncbi:hypothetical protein CEXT_606741 [Caerostris extrusa]|uniref:Transposase n=1 Tax=Caerostris extrusa TaxID=172846 RepID=A0AAV4VCN6_CAEEX|nr:hypothetical protein CEXT_606741 [Caerostris extrusa]
MKTYSDKDFRAKLNSSQDIIKLMHTRLQKGMPSKWARIQQKSSNLEKKNHLAFSCTLMPTAFMINKVNLWFDFILCFDKTSTRTIKTGMLL